MHAGIYEFCLLYAGWRPGLVCQGQAGHRITGSGKPHISTFSFLLFFSFSQELLVKYHSLPAPGSVVYNTVQYLAGLIGKKFSWILLGSLHAQMYLLLCCSKNAFAKMPR
jgi:hypothetical protein